MNIMKFIDNNDIKQIKKKLSENMGINTTYCDKLIGKGGIGNVYIQGVGPTMKISIHEKTITVPVVVKKAKIQGKFKMSIINNILYIYSYKDLTCEAIILQYAMKLWYDKITPHVPLMIGYSKCGDFDTLVDTIVTEKQGLDYTIDLEIDGFARKSLFHNKQYNEPFRSTLATLEDLLYYIDVNKNADQILLPNHSVCNIVELIDYFTISFLHTSMLLFDACKMVMNDMHAGNFFIHWLNENSYLGSKSISDVKEIYYNVDDVIFAVKTFGIILKLGDIGSCLLNPKPDVFILGQGINLKQTYPLVEYHKHPGITSFITFTSILKLLSYELAQKTKMWQIIMSSPYNEIVLGNPVSDFIVKRLLTPKQLLLKYFMDYSVSEQKSNSSEVLIV